ncbi:hypothetical protein D9M73_98040 [compost metagenome]
MLEAEPPGQDELPGDVLLGIGEHRRRMDALLIGGLQDTPDLGVIGEVREEPPIDRFIVMIQAEHPARRLILTRCEPKLLRADIDAVEEVGARLVRRRRVEVVKLTPRKVSVRTYARQCRPTEIPVELDMTAIGFVVPKRIGGDRYPHQVRKGLVEAPAGKARIAGLKIIRVRSTRRILEVGQKLKPAAVGRVAHIVSHQVDRRDRVRPPLERYAHRFLVFVAQRLAGVAIILPRTALVGRERDARGHRAAERTGHEAVQVEGIILAERRIHAGVEIARRACTDNVDRAARRISAVESALRPAQHFDPLDVVNGTLRHHAVGIGNPIDIDADGVGVVRRIIFPADAAQPILRLPRAELLIDFQAGNGIFQVAGGVDVARFDLVATDHRERDRHVLLTLAPMLRRHDNVAGLTRISNRSASAGFGLGLGCLGHPQDDRLAIVLADDQPAARDQLGKHLAVAEMALNSGGSAIDDACGGEKDLNMGLTREIGQSTGKRLGINCKILHTACIRRSTENNRHNKHRRNKRRARISHDH